MEVSSTTKAKSPAKKKSETQVGRPRQRRCGSEGRLRESPDFKALLAEELEKAEGQRLW
jgi:hypothetical protein